MIPVPELRPPNDQRGFVHKKLLRIGTGIIRTVVPGAGTALDIAGGVIGGRSQRPTRAAAERVKFGVTDVRPGRRLAAQRGCSPPLRMDLDGVCRFPSSPADVSVGGGMTVGFGEAVMGQYGAALRPGNRATNVAVCPRGSVLGNDGLCYNKRDISNKERMWPRGPRPLGTPEEMRAVRIASRFAGRFERTTKRMQKIGLVKKPAARRRAPKQIASRSGITVIDTE